MRKSLPYRPSLHEKQTSLSNETNRFSNQKASIRLVKWNLLLLVLFFSALCGVIYRIEQKNQMDIMKKAGKQAVEQTSVALENWIGDQIRMVKLIAQEPRVVHACKNPKDAEAVSMARDFLRSVHKQCPYYENLPLAAKLPEGESFETAVDGETRVIRDGTFFIDTVDGKTIGKCGPQFSYIRAIYDGKDYFISQVYPSILRGNPIFVISAPVTDNSGIIVGVAIIAPQMSYFTDLFVNKLKIGETGYMFFMDDREMMISHPRQEMVLKKESIEKIKHISSRIIRGEAEFTGIFEGMEKIYISRKINIPKNRILHDWYITFTQTQEEIMASSNYFLRFLTVSGLSFVMVFSIGMILLSRIIIENPVKRITDALKQGLENAASSSVQVANASQMLADGVSKQAASIEETSSSLEEMAAMTRLNADNAKLASTLADETRISAESCSLVMKEMRSAIDQVSESSRETQKIVHIIDDIAFQTNLLALNASVEAARAGASGAGFSVVADEVRSLSMRSAEAVKSTSAQIEDIRKKIRDAMNLFSRSIDEFMKMDENAKKVNGLVNEIAAASREQAQGIGQVNQSVAEMDDVVQRNASSVEEWASVSEELSAQAQGMRRLVMDLVGLIAGGKASREPSNQ